MNNLLEKQKGITLVALVITIIVMLILASVTISMLVNGGLIDKAKGATSDTKTATENEQNIIKEYENLIDEYAAPSSGVKNGIIAEEGSLLYYVDGEIALGAGLIQRDGDYYYVKSSGELVIGSSYFVSNTNDLMPRGTYTFGDDGKMIIEEKKNGIIAEEGSLFYYVDGIRTRSWVNTSR